MKIYRISHLILLFFLICFSACSTKIPSISESAKNTHIPNSFRNLSDNLKAKNAKNNTPQSLENIENQPFSLEQFIALVDDKPLHSLVKVGLKNNTNVLTMISRIKQAKSQLKINTAGIFPTISAGLNSSYIDNRTLSQSTVVRPGANSINANVSMSWELDLFGKLNALRKSSKKDYAQAQSNLAYAQISLIAEVGTLYFTLRDNAYNIALARQSLENLQQIESINASRYKLGLIDVSTYRSFVSNVTTQKNNLETLQYTFEQNKNALLVLLNISSDEMEKIVDFADSKQYELPIVADFSVANLPSEILLSRPDVEANLYAFHSQLYKATNANAARLPTISLSGSIGEVLYSTNGAGSIVFQLANSITMPLLNRTSLKQTYLIQKELGNEAFYTLQNSINTALGEIENALFDMESKNRQVQNQQSLYEVGLKAYESDSSKIKRGLLDKNDFLTNENTYLNLQTQLFTSKANALISTITLYKALGGNLAFENKSADSHKNDLSRLESLESQVKE